MDAIIGKSPRPAAPPPVPTGEDPAIAAAREKARLAEKNRRGRAASILTGSDEDKLGGGSSVINRPGASGG
jgi:hypothetical protein